MNTQFHVDGSAQPQKLETEAERQGRIAREEVVIAKARADIAAGRGIEDEDLEAWLDSLEQDPNAPLPSPRRTPALRSIFRIWLAESSPRRTQLRRCVKPAPG